MNLTNEIEFLAVHAEGEIGRVIIAGAPDIPGDTMIDKMNYINEVDDSLLKFCLYEPRGASHMTINLLVPPITEGADMGFFPMQADGVHAMSGSNTMCVTTALIEYGLVKPTGAETKVRLDTPAGLIVAKAMWNGSKVERVEIDMPTSFVEHLDHPLEVETLGTISVDVAFGGCYFVLVNAKRLGFEIAPHEARELAELGAKINDAAVEQIKVQHPEVAAFNRVEYPMYVAGGGEEIRNATIIFPGRLDRSPCGTGTSARLAVMHARGQLEVGKKITARSIINGEFHAHIEETTVCGERAAIKPKISGRAWIYGYHKLGIHPTDPFPLGYTLSDTWGTGTPR